MATEPSACCICGGDMMTEEHHLRHQAQGGTSGQTVWMCSNCHAAAHSQARALKSKNPDIKSKQYFPLELRQRAHFVVQALLRGELEYNTERERFQDHAMQPQMFEVSPRQLQRLHMIKRQNGFTNMNDFWQSVVAKLTGVAAWPKGEPERDGPPTKLDLAMLRNSQK